MDSHHDQHPGWRRAALGFTAAASWVVAVALFAGYAVATRSSLDRESYFLGGAGWLFGLLACYLVARVLRRE